MGARLAMWRVRKVGDDKEEECGTFGGVWGVGEGSDAENGSG